jgi:hypothetical protein
MSPPIDGRPAEIVRKLKHYLREVPNINSLLAQLRPPHRGRDQQNKNPKPAHSDFAGFGFIARRWSRRLLLLSDYFDA